MRRGSVAGVGVLARYGALLRLPGVAGAVSASILGRISLVPAGLGILLMVRQTTGSYAAAGAVTAAYSLSFALAAPALARWADGAGPRRALRTCGVGQPMALVTLVGLAHLHSPVILLATGAVAVGGLTPPLGAVMRALWAQLAQGRDAVTAYSLEAVLVELCFTLGPLLVTVLIFLGGPSAAVLASAVLSGSGALLLAAMPLIRAVVPHPDRQGLDRVGPLAAPGVRALLITMLCVGAGFGTIEVAVPAFLQQHGSRPGDTGVLLAVWSAGSMAGGLVYGAVHPRWPPVRQITVLAVLLATGMELPVLASSPAVLGCLLFIYGTTIAPYAACNAYLLAAAAPAGTQTEVFAWNGSMIFGGAAAGNAASGYLAQHHGGTAALWLAACLGAATLLVSTLGRVAVGAGDLVPRQEELLG